ncbi:hypothetical protein M5Z94_01210 [Oceanotoga teriensis]|nr:hypothetical protein [Oceanotoga teriensis]
MNKYNCCFHNHTVLSPCADITMTPEIYNDILSSSSIDWISITDHNSAENMYSFNFQLNKIGIKLIPGIEVQTSEEVHIIIYFKYIKECIKFSKIIENTLIIKNYDPEKLGYQILVNEKSEFIDIKSSPYLGSSSNLTVEEVYNLSKKFKSIIYPAHIFRAFGLIYQLGLPLELDFDAVEVKNEDELIKAQKLGYKRFIYGNDSHFPDQLKNPSCILECESRTFDELKKSLYNGKVKPIWPH